MFRLQFISVLFSSDMWLIFLRHGLLYELLVSTCVCGQLGVKGVDEIRKMGPFLLSY